MKKLILFALFFAFCFTTAQSSNLEIPPRVRPQCSMLIGGLLWEANATVIIGQAPTESGGYGLTILAKDDNGITFSAGFSSDGEIGPGTYTCKFKEIDGGATLENYAGKTYLGGFVSKDNEFTFVITEVSGSGISRKFRGVFSGTMEAEKDDKIEISSGSFSNM